MRAFQIRHFLAASAATAAFLLALNIAGNAIFAPPGPDAPSPAAPTPSAPTPAASTPAETPVAEAPAPPATTREAPIADRLVTADVAAGQALAARCAACHNLAPGGPNRVGPALFAVVGRPVATHEGFAYSAAMRRKAEGGAHWDEAALDAFLAAPAQAVPGTIMSFPGLPDARQRADLIAWLRTLKPAN